MNGDQFNQLLSAITGLEERFDRNDTIMTGIQERLDGNDDRFDKLFFVVSDMNKRLNSFQENVATRADIDEIIAQLDAMRGFTEDEQLETVAVTAQVDRHDSWITKASPIVGLKYPS